MEETNIAKNVKDTRTKRDPSRHECKCFGSRTQHNNIVITEGIQMNDDSTD